MKILKAEVIAIHHYLWDRFSGTFITDKGNFKDIMNTSIKCSRKKCSIGVVGKRKQ